MMEKTLNLEIIHTALSYIGQEEILGNQGFKVEEFEQKIKNSGWLIGQAWCSYFAEAVWKEAYQQWDATMFTRLDTLFSASAVQTYKNFHKAKDFVTSRKFKAGCLVVWQNYRNWKPHWTGHIAIGVKSHFKAKKIETIDGNTNDKGGREGYIVANKIRSLDFTTKEKGLVLIGFIHPKEY